jgi:hypothetical protein
MNVPPWAGFVADFPDDQVESGDDIQVYGGRNVAMALGEILKSLGCSRISTPESAEEQGWEFAAYYRDRCRVSCRVQSFHPVFWLLFEDVSASKKGASAYVELWRQFGNALERDLRFRKILWRAFKDGPPDWDEVEAASEPALRPFDEEFPPSDVEPNKSRPGCCLALALIWIWFLLSGIAGVVFGLHNQVHKERVEDIGTGVLLITLCLAPIFIVAIETIRRRLVTPSPTGDG